MPTLPPDNGDKKSATITADAVMLAAQNERIDRLVGSIEHLTEAVGNRPTKYDLRKTKNRLRNQLLATIAVSLILFSFVFLNERSLERQCQDRNANTQAFRSLIVYLLSAVENESTAEALERYLNTLVTVDC